MYSSFKTKDYHLSVFQKLRRTPTFVTRLKANPISLNENLPSKTYPYIFSKYLSELHKIFERRKKIFKITLFQNSNTCNHVKSRIKHDRPDQC